MNSYSESVSIYKRLLEAKTQGRRGLFVLIDPDKGLEGDLVRRSVEAQRGGAELVLIGGSHLNSDNFNLVIPAIKTVVDIPIVLFPGGASQLSVHADALLLLSLISGRNPQYLIGEHVTAAARIKQLGLEAIPTGYMLIESGKTTAIEFISNTKPIPRDQPGIAASHALAGELLGMKLIYLEAGSGAKYPVPGDMISVVAEQLTIPLVVGGGIRTPEQAQSAVKAGADFIVVGNALEEDAPGSLIEELVSAVNI